MTNPVVYRIDQLLRSGVRVTTIDHVMSMASLSEIDLYAGDRLVDALLVEGPSVDRLEIVEQAQLVIDNLTSVGTRESVRAS